MKKRFPILGIVLTALIVLSISSCDEEMAGPMEPIVDAVVDTPGSEPVSPPSEPVAPTTQEVTVSITPAQIESPAVGAQLTVSLNIAEAMDIQGFDIRIGFDPTALQYVESAGGDYLPANDEFSVWDVPSTNSVRLFYVSLTDPAAVESGTLTTVTFEVVAAKASTLQLMDVIIGDSNGIPLPVTAQNGMITAP